jgi:hypothetical protein
MLSSASTPISTTPATIVSAPATRARRNGSRSTRVASSSPPSVAVEGWITAPWPSGAR